MAELLEHPLLVLEEAQKASGHQLVAGVDEAGRGPLAGPVVACALIIYSYHSGLAEINDSKKLSEKKREKLAEALMSDPNVAFGIGIADREEIDAINILEATKKAMQRAVEALPKEPDILLVDGMPLEGKIPSQGIIKGDSKSLSIAAASILAKVTRDRLMCEYDQQWPEYGFAGHKGYGTKKHLIALNRVGPCPIHRRSFAPVREAEAVTN